MTYDTTPRSDLVDRGICKPNQTKPLPGQPQPDRPTVFMCGGDMVTPDGDVSVRYFGIDGLETERTEIAVASRTVRDGKTTLEVRVSTGGGDAGHFVDPRGVMWNPDFLVRQDSATGKARYEYRRVTQKVFEDYLRYLTGKDSTFLRRAERSFLNHG